METHVEYEYRCLYAQPVNPIDYLSYSFAIIHREVANSLEELDKSTNIRFYLYTEEEEKRN